MNCPKCNQSYPDDHIFCPKDGTPLHGAPLQPENKRRTLLIGLSVLAGLILLILNLVPLGVKAGAGNCTLSLVSIKTSDNGKKGGVNGDVSLMLSVYNGNLIPVDLDSLHFSLFVNGKKFATGALPEDTSIHFPARDSASLEVPLKIYLWNLFAVGTTVFTSEQMVYQAKGEAIFDTWFGLFRFPFAVNKIDLPIM